LTWVIFAERAILDSISLDDTDGAIVDGKPAIKRSRHVQVAKEADLGGIGMRIGRRHLKRPAGSKERSHRRKPRQRKFLGHCVEAIRSHNACGNVYKHVSLSVPQRDQDAVDAEGPLYRLR
jgi:hypothetical protein